MNEFAFESLVNSDRYKTVRLLYTTGLPFESLVNSDRYKTSQEIIQKVLRFESLVNSGVEKKEGEKQSWKIIT